VTALSFLRSQREVASQCWNIGYFISLPEAPFVRARGSGTFLALFTRSMLARQAIEQDRAVRPD
jgi:hypothetical protein